MAVFGDRRLLARAGTALLLANVRFWLTIAPRVKAQLARWEQQARTIEHPSLQALALQKLREEHFNAQVAATLATLAPRAHRQATIEAIVAYEVMYDYLDGLTEQPSIDPLSAGWDLYRAFIDAVSPGHATLGGYYASLPFDDGGYLQQLASVVHNALESLPSSTAVHQAAQQAAARCAEAQLRAHATPTLGTRQVETWAKSQTANAQVGWQEFLAGAASSVLAVHALIASAAAEHTTPTQAAAIDGAYLSICALSTMLDSLVDYQRDTEDGQAGYIRYYQNTSQLSDCLAQAARHGIQRTRGLPHRGHHTMTLAGVAAYYLSAPTASSKLAQEATQDIRNELAALITPTLAVMRTWRAAKRLSTTLQKGR